MPTYSYTCSNCYWSDEIVKPMAESDREERCRQCGSVMIRNWGAEGHRCAGDSYRRELHSDALAIHPEQRAEHQRLYPDVPLDSANRPVFTKYSQHNAYLEKRGLVKPSSRKEIY